MEIDAYVFDIDDFTALQRINQRLYDDRVLTSDHRRDLANAMSVLLHKAVGVDTQELIQQERVLS